MAKDLYMARTPMLYDGRFLERGEVMHGLGIRTDKMRRNVELLIDQKRIIPLTDHLAKEVIKCDDCSKEFGNVEWMHTHRALNSCGKDDKALANDPNQKATDEELKEMTDEEAASKKKAVLVRTKKAKHPKKGKRSKKGKKKKKSSK